MKDAQEVTLHTIQPQAHEPEPFAPYSCVPQGHRLQFLTAQPPAPNNQTKPPSPNNSTGDCRKALDKRVTSERVLHSYDDRMDICHVTVDSESIRLANRDYVLLRRWNNRNSGAVAGVRRFECETWAHGMKPIKPCNHVPAHNQSQNINSSVP